ncbi:MAG: type II 3-dehydroquinate dehydratase [Wenzhouxiangella sp.]|nr:type II 3-dehydroquinate dehydratase [Wenzhouxiangella sp.]
MPSVLVIHGPNLNLLGRREPEIYGRTSLEEIDSQLHRFAGDCGLTLSCFQSNAEHELIERIHAAATDETNWIIINPAGLTHTSVILRDALAAVDLPFIEVHLSNPERREPFRQHSYLADLATGRISGLGADSYLLALQAVVNRLDSKP